MHEGIIWVAHGTFHLVIDNTLVSQSTVRVIGVVELKSVTLLSKIHIIQIGQESAIGVDTHQVAEILSVLRREWVHGKVASSPCIHVSVETALDHVHEWIADWVVLGAAEGEMLQDVRLASVIVRRRPEQNRKDVVHVRRVQM